MNAPVCTAVVVTRDRPALLRDALTSIATQHTLPTEVRIGDDGERPISPADLPPALPVTVIRCDGGSAAAARNRAAAGAVGEVLAFLDDDDLWRAEHVERLVAAFADPRIELAYADVIVAREVVGADGARTVVARRRLARDWDTAIMRENDYVPPSAVAVRRAFFERLGGFDESFRFSEDWDFLLRAARLCDPRRIAGVTVEIRLRPAGNASADFGEERLACLRRLEERHGLARLVPRTFWEIAQIVGESA